MALTFAALREFVDTHIRNKLPEKIDADTDHNAALNNIIDKIEEQAIMPSEIPPTDAQSVGELVDYVNRKGLCTRFR